MEFLNDLPEYLLGFFTVSAFLNWKRAVRAEKAVAEYASACKGYEAACRSYENTIGMYKGMRGKPDLEKELESVSSSQQAHIEPPVTIPVILDPGKQALEMLKRGDKCDWYSIQWNPGEMHEAFDCLEIYWRTRVDKPSDWGRAFDERAGFRVRWHVSATRRSYVEAYGLDLMETILDARNQADRLVELSNTVQAMGKKHPVLELWKNQGEDRKYDFYSLELDKWKVSLEYPGGYAWGHHKDLDRAVAEALSKTPGAAVEAEETLE